ncbi:hypothetical protein MCOR27_000952 [Pyricularia oryzae]|uniref:DUF155 domain-containing protein n=2 Tax=Pyricularia TaxID=48558 RepID=A0ABQ8N5V0_PYRGI|nr:hypothetical protein MCOR01_008021 [Pyricularia oryzae]KAI6291457.1 hypothetical protein MCOR33_010605 [Pyricularia grisea]KAH9433308.1 hypothetical protein MCOR02_005362 [Pyricularia oryzae]KAI6252937.1 hypothetical protein MCOR19_010469 [Pyricularia oryzae]KAI6284048.1 hypothetical protein MCOR26_002176 [Pyricularia oryzae]
MAEAVTETSPLLSTVSEPTTTPEFPRPNSKRTVTFNPNPVTRTIEPERQPLRRRISTNIDVARASGQRSPGGSGPPTPTSSISTGSLAGAPPMLVALNSKLRRRNSHGGTQGSMPGSNNLLPAPGGVGLVAGAGHLPKIGPQRSTKKAQKLKLLPTPELADDGDDDQDEESGREVYSQYTRIKDPNARRDAARLGKADRDRLPRVTAYCTANKYQMDGLMHWLKGSRSRAKGANPKLVDECIYTPYQYKDTPPPPPGRGARIRRVASAQNAADAAEDAARAAVNADGILGSEVTSDSPEPMSTQQRRHSTGDVEATPPRFSQEDLIDLEPEAISDVQDGRSEARIESLGEGDHSEISSSPQERDHEHGHDHDQSPSSADHRDEMISTHHEPINERPADFDIEVHTPEVFLFDYGVVVIWGMTMAQERRFLKEIAKFETEKLATEEVETEHFNFYYTREYQPRIYNDFITLRDKHNYMTKLAISHALAQSVKTSLFEELIASTVDTCKDIPTQIALTGKINLSRTQINMQIGELFILRISIHLNGSVLDTPELFWVEPQLEPLYAAVRSYLEMDQRVGLLNERLDVIADLLAVLKDQLSHGHGEKLEWIVIVLIAAEILVAAVNIVVDLYAGVD